jgi:hypothetical protein
MIVALFEDKVFADAIKMRGLGWALLLCNTYPYKKRKINTETGDQWEYGKGHRKTTMKS